MTKESRRPPRLSMASSMESRTTVFMNGHHKPVHKINDIHNRLGAPYKIPARSRTLPGHREFAQRSTDSLLLSKDLPNGPHNHSFHNSVTSAPHPARRVKSEHGSPTVNALPMPPDNQIPPINIPPYDPNAYSYSPFSGGSPAVSSAGSNPWEGGFPEQFPDNLFITYEMANERENNGSSAGLGSDQADIDWSTYNLPGVFGNNAAEYRMSNGAAVPSQPPSYASFDRFSHFSHPALTSSSGDISDVEDYVPIAEQTSLQNSSQDALNDFSSVGGDEPTQAETFRLSSASSYAGMPQASMLASDSLDSLDIDDYLKITQAQTREIALQNQRLQDEQEQQLEQSHTQTGSNMPSIFNQPTDPAQHSFSVQEPQGHVHAIYQDGMSGLGSQPVTTTMTLSNDPIHSSALIGINGIMSADERDDGWVR